MGGARRGKSDHVKFQGRATETRTQMFKACTSVETLKDRPPFCVSPPFLQSLECLLQSKKVASEPHPRLHFLSV